MTNKHMFQEPLSAYTEIFKATFPARVLFFNEPMKDHCSFRAGGSADLMIRPDSIDGLIKAVDICRSNGIPFYTVGNCTNLLVRDAGYRGVIIKISDALSAVELSDTADKDGYVCIAAQSGVLLSELAGFALSNSLTGLEFASGIPGTLGGAVCMNAGAYDGEIKDILRTASVLNTNGSGEITRLDNAQLAFGYRTSAVMEGYIVLSAVLALRPGSKRAIADRMNELSLLRAQKQPLDLPSAGSTFKRPPGYFAGKLIADAGLTGYTHGGAKVSEKHSGFVVNYNNATASDIIDLIDYVIATVRQSFGVTLEPEVRIIGAV